MAAGKIPAYAVLTTLGLFGAALLYGDGIITPAISVLGAVEGLEVASPVLVRLVVPISLGILAMLFAVQRFGTDRIGKVFGPVMLVWFSAIGSLGLAEIAREPGILRAINPWYGVLFFNANGWLGFFALGAVVLVVTGAEALYADMGHFGRRPIRTAWFIVALPALLLNYFGQGALVLRDPSAAMNPFYRLVPAPLLYPMVALATAAAIIASQALISGAFSLTQQAIQLGYSPRLKVTHTSKHEAGQIYIGEVNSALAIGCLALVLGFRSSTNLAAAYGIAVTGTMAITTILFTVIARQQLGWPRWRAFSFLTFFLLIDLAFLSANAVKIEHGGWFPLVVAAVVYIMLTTWKKGRLEVQQLLREASLPIDTFLESVRLGKPVRVPGTAVFMTSDTNGAPVVLLHHLKHNKVLHEQVILLSVLSAGIPEVAAHERAAITPLGDGFYRVIARYGFMQTPNVREVMGYFAPAGIKVRPGDTSYFLGRELLIPTGNAKMPMWRKKVFVFMSRNARTATEFFGLPPNRVVELGAQIEF
jgi:KUP system potassium uptake protein